MKNSVFLRLFWACFIQLLLSINTSFASGICRDDERSLLLQLRRSLNYSRSKSIKLASWNQTVDCCQWSGVQCNSSTGNVIGLDLSGESIANSSDSFSSLLSLQSLQSLNLANNSFGNAEIPPGLGRLVSLSYLNLSSAGFRGQVPMELSQLSELESLDLSVNSLDDNIPMSLFSLPSLQVLKLDRNKFNGSLQELSNMSLILDTLDLSTNNLDGPVPKSLFQLQGLKALNLSSNNFSGSLDLNAIQQLKNLTSLELSYNSLSVHANGSNVSFSSFPQLSTLQLGSCDLQVLPDFLRKQSKLQHLDLSGNRIKGSIPQWIWRVGNGYLNRLNLSNNNFTGLDRPPSGTSTLKFIDISSNQIQGEVPTLSTAMYLDFSNNKFTSISPNIGNSLLSTIYLSLSKNAISHEIPVTLCNASNLKVLDLSSNNLNGTIPGCIIKRTSTLGVLSLRKNQLRGNIADEFPKDCKLRTFDINDNLLQGTIPQSLTNCKQLEVLDVGKNQLYDVFPCQLKALSNLWVLVLRANKFHGSVGCPRNRISWPNLHIVDIASNNFDGELQAHCFFNLTALTSGADNPQEALTQLTYPVFPLENIYYQNTVILTFKGAEVELQRVLTIFTSIDFSNNSFNGNIPDNIGDLQTLIMLNFSYNRFTGSIPSSIGKLNRLESLDLSHNDLNGSIPSQLGNLNFLGVLNLSFNNLVGKIPESTQLQSFTASSYKGNPALCGAPLPNCLHSSPSAQKKYASADRRFDWQSIFIGSGFGTGAGLVIAPLIFCKKGRKWFNKRVDKLVSAIFLSCGIDCTTLDVVIQPEDGIGHQLFDISGYHGDETDDETNMGRFCVFCSKLDIERKRVIHNSSCICHGSTASIWSSFSLSSSK